LDEFQRIAEGKATTMGHIKRNHLDEALVCIPNDELFGFQNSKMGPYIKKQISNDLEALYFMEIRNNLLEKLI
jgi:type I restriction enzyme S subunit